MDCSTRFKYVKYLRTSLPMPACDTNLVGLSARIICKYVLTCACKVSLFLPVETQNLPVV